MSLQTVISVWLCLVPHFFISAGCTYTSIKTRNHQVVFHYDDQRRSEKDLPICTDRSVCSVLHKRYWLPLIADRLCRCANNDECPWRWTENSDDQTMMLNNRAQLKFCKPIKNLTACDPKKTALITEKISGNGMKPTFEIKVKCYCSPNHHWHHFKTSSHITTATRIKSEQEEFKCSQLRRCHSTEFCGNVRVDYSSFYYACSCPPGHICEYKDKSQRDVTELLYKGPAYQAFCEKYIENDDSDY